MSYTVYKNRKFYAFVCDSDNIIHNQFFLNPLVDLRVLTEAELPLIMIPPLTHLRKTKK